MKKNIVGRAVGFASASLALLTLASVGTANAQGLLNRITSGTGTQVSAPTISNGDLIQSFTTSRTHLLDAQANFMEAFDLKDEADLLRAERDALSSGTVDNSRLKKVESVSGEAQQKIDAKMAEESELSAEGREFYSAGLISLTAALLEGVKTAAAAEQFAANTKGNPMNLMSSEGRAAGYVAKEAPGYLVSLRKNTGMAIAYGRRNNIEAPADATSLMDGM